MQIAKKQARLFVSGDHERKFPIAAGRGVGQNLVARV